MSYTIQIRRDLAANWTTKNSTLAAGEIGLETDTRKAKIGDGSTAWTGLSYWNPSGVSGAVASVFGRTGVVVATSGDYSVGQVTGAAPLASPALTGTPTVPTASPLTSTTQAASTAYADAAVAVEKTRALAAEALDLPLAGGTMSGALNMGANPIHNLGSPSVWNDAANKGYVDALSFSGDVTGSPSTTLVGQIQGVGVTVTEAKLVSDLNNATTRNAGATIFAGEETIFYGSTSGQTLTLPASPPSSSINTVTNISTVSVTLAPGAGSTLNNFGTTGNVVIPPGYNFSLVYIGTVWYVQSAGPNTLTSGVYNMRNYGATGNGTTDDTAACNAALLACHNAGGGTVIAPPGTYLLSAALVIYSNTHLIAYGATFTEAANSNCNMIANFATTPNRSVTDAAITTATATLTSNTANFTSADVGATVAVAGANQAGQVLTANIVTINSTTSVTLDTNAQNTVTAAACSIYYRDSNIEIAGGTWNRNNNGYTGGGAANQNTTQLRFLDGLYVHDMSLSAGTVNGYQLALAGVTNFVIKRITVNAPSTTPNTDGVSIVGPATRGIIDTVYGADGDDFIALHTNANQGTNSAQCVGNLSDILVTNIFPNGVGQGAVKINSSTGQTANAITVRTVHGTYTGGISFASQQSNITDILFEDIDIISPAASGANICYINCPNATGGTLTFKNVALRSYAFTTAINMFQVAAGSNLGTLILENLTWEAGTTGSGSNVLQLLASSGSTTTVNSILVSKVTGQNSAQAWTNLVSAQQYSTIDTLTIRDVSALTTQAGNYPLFNAAGAVQSVILDGIYLNGGGELVDTATTASAMQILASNIVSYAMHRLFKISSTAQCDIMLTNVNVNTLNQAGMINVGGTGAIITVRGDGLLNPSAVALFNGTTPTAPARVVLLDARVDVATIAANLGDRAYNTNVASAVLGPVIYNGTAWVPVGLQIDPTASDIQPIGAQAAGNSAKVSAANHVHAANVWRPSSRGLLLANYAPALAMNTLAVTAGTLYLIKLLVDQAMTLTNICWIMSAAGSGASTGSFTGAYSSAGTLLSGSSDIASYLTASGAAAIPLTTPQALSAGTFVWAALLSNLATTQPTVVRGAGFTQANNGFLTAATYEFATNGTSITSLPGSITPSSNVSLNAALWAGGS